MEKIPAVMGIDVGTQGVKVGLFTLNGLHTLSYKRYNTHFPHPGWAEQNPQDWWKAIKEAVRECVSSAPNTAVKGICVSATSSTVLCVDREGAPLAPAIMWMDMRASQEAREISNIDDPILRYSGGEVSAEWMLPKTLWLKRNRPELYKQSYKIVEQLDWINYLLTGKWVASQCNTTCKWGYSSKDGGWKSEFYTAAGLRDFYEKWPTEVIPMGELIGPLTKQAGEDLNLDADIPVFQGGIDAYAAMIGLGVVNEGQMAVIMGTSFVHLVLSNKPYFHKGLWGPYPDAVFKDMWVLEGGQASCASIVNWVVDEMAREYGDDSIKAHQKLINEASELGPGANGLISLDMWQGNRTPFRDSLITGVIAGLTLNTNRAAIYRSLMESVAFGTRAIIDIFKSNGYQINGVVACGGPTKNSLWLQIIADVLQIPITINKFTEAGILGGAILASVGAGWFHSIEESAKNFVKAGYTVYPNKDVTAEYSFYYQCYLDLYKSIKPILHRIYNYRANSRRLS
ncbi:FGGY-family carbohydrate kinase [Neomoorella humiferrea]|uniref:Ribulokinase n=1 Tax=Neomoorella humiferrea TaxID=676965 RepID=A0A2T0ASZ1_9FIRM|nr:FGGY-family carbohydrate kinase [Moorella humiferrea]PRR73328.1 Ribulokinase [Moorella humiferrea]